MRRALLCCLLANVIGGTTFLAMAKGHESGLPTLTFSFLRTLLSTLLFALVAARHGELAPRFSARDWGLVLLVGVPGFALPLVLGVRGVALSTPGIGSILALVEPIAIVPLSWLFLRERLRPARLLGIALGLGGALLVVFGDRAASAAIGDGGRLSGNALLAVQNALWAVYTVTAKPLVGRCSPLSVSLWSTAAGCAALGLLAPLEWLDHAPALAPALAPLRDWLALERAPADGAALLAALKAAAPSAIYLAFFASFLAVFLWNEGLKGVPATIMAAFIFVQPAVGLAIDALRGAALPSAAVFLGLAAIGAAIALVSRDG